MRFQLAALVFSAACALAQSSTARLSGTVRDSTGAVIPQASVRVANAATGTGSRTNSNDAGVYIFPAAWRLSPHRRIGRHAAL